MKFEPHDEFQNCPSVCHLAVKDLDHELSRLISGRTCAVNATSGIHNSRERVEKLNNSKFRVTPIA